jgi:hypothetical protein
VSPRAKSDTEWFFSAIFNARDHEAVAKLMPRTAFFAYPAEPKFLADTIEQSVPKVRAARDLIVSPWSKLPIIGLKLNNLIRERIAGADFLLADVTYPNFNVYYEIGYAVGQHKPFVLTMNYAVDKANEHLNLTGLFDTIGQLRYQNSEEIVKQLENCDALAWSNEHLKEKDHTQPLYLLDALRKTNFRNYITQSISNSSVRHRSFDPEEVSRLSITSAIGDVSASAGVIIPLLSTHIGDWQRHNLRAAFLAGLCHGIEIEPLIIQYEDLPAPLDFRDFIDTTRTRIEVEQSVSEYCRETLIKNQQRGPALSRVPRTILNEIDIGSSSAENESNKLGRYFIRTAEYQRASRADKGIVAGRKGSGKSAIFYQIAEDKSRDKRNVILELNPASHSLSELRQELLTVVNVGIFDHTVAAFWQYILYAEIILKIRELVLPKAKYEMTLLRQIESVERQFRLSEEMVAGDFTSRLELAVRSMVTNLRAAKPGTDIRSTLTKILFETDIPRMRDSIVELAGGFEKIVLLFDNLDKGWPPRQVEPHDIRTVHHLIESLNKIERELRRSGIQFEYLLFLRSDVYDNLVADTSDRGKFNLIRVDWSDSQQLEALIRERVVSNVAESKMDAAWQAVNPVLPGDTTAIIKMIESSLMRPRFLIELCEKAISFAINRRHGMVTVGDLEDALKQQSLFLVSDFGYELRDVAGITEGIFYKFIGKGDTLTPEEIIEIVGPTNGISSDRLIDLLVWYGFLGIPAADGKPIFIYDRLYDMRRLEADRAQQADNLLYIVNPAFLRGLVKDR